MSQTPKISFEFFPPKTPEGREKLLAVRDQLSALKPEYFSVTYGAGGSTRDNTRDIVTQFHKDGYEVAPHLSFGGDTRETVIALLQSYRDAGVH
ncbi:MAG TPA: methylenetetrahydrofolate reductase, partial [Porticoccaceae bacterium]